MNALMKKEENNMSVEERLAGLESDVKYLRQDVLDSQQDIKSVGGDVKSLDSKIQTVAADLDRKIQAVATDLQSFKTYVVEQFGSVLVAIESLKTSIEKSKIWMLVTGVGVITSTVITVVTALKLLRDFHP